MSAEGQDDGRGRLPAPMVQVPGGAAADGATVQQLESAHWIQVSLAATRRIWALIYPFSIEYNRLAGMGRDELVDTTHCMMPCSFLEYQVFIICLLPEYNTEHPLQIHLLGQRWSYGDISFHGRHWSDSSSLICHSNCTGQTCMHCWMFKMESTIFGKASLRTFILLRIYWD